MKYKDKIRNKLIVDGITVLKEKGQAKDFLKVNYEYYKDKGWSKEEFIEIYNTIGMLHKGKNHGDPLFD